MEIQQTIMGQMIQYVISLDWSFIITFILMAYVLNQPNVKGFLYKVFKFRMKTRYRTLITGVIYGVILYFLRGRDPNQIEELFRALLFAMIFHKLMIEQVVNFFSKGFGWASADKPGQDEFDSKR